MSRPGGVRPAGATWPASRWEPAAALAVLVFAALDVAGWVRDVPAAHLAVRVVWVLLYLGVALRLATAVLAGRRGEPALAGPARLLRRHWPLAALLAAAVLSTAWSLAPLETLRTSLSLAGTTLLGVAIGLLLSPRQIAWVVGAALAAVVVSSLLALPLLPDRIVVEPLTGKWQGLTNHKNSLAALSAIGALFFAAPACRRTWTRWHAVACAACLLGVLLAGSVTAALALAVGLGALAWFTVSDRLGFGARQALLALLGLLAAGALAAALAIGPVTAALGKDPNLNGRVPLWRASVQILRERPWTGYGYQAVWGRKEATLLPHLRVTANRSATSAHNAFLHTASELGAPAALLLVAYFVATLWRAARRLERDPTPFSLFVLAYLMACGTLNLAEAHLLRLHSPFWILFVAVAVMLRSEPRGETPARR